MTREQTRFARRLKKYILAEPKHIHMGYFTIDTAKGWVANVANSREQYSILKKDIGEICGNAGCIAGSACFLKRGEAWSRCRPEQEGRALLGLSQGQAGALFFFPFGRPAFTSASEWALYEDERRKLLKLTPGTQAYANVVADALQKTIDAYGFKGRL